MTPQEAADWLEQLENEGLLTVVERDLNPDDPRMGRAQFLVTPVADEQVIQERFDDVALDYHDVDSAPDHFRHAALPPE